MTAPPHVGLAPVPNAILPFWRFLIGCSEKAVKIDADLSQSHIVGLTFVLRHGAPASFEMKPERGRAVA